MILYFWLILFGSWLLLNGYLALVTPLQLVDKTSKTLSLIKDNHLLLQFILIVPIGMLYSSIGYLDRNSGVIVFILGIIGLIKVLVFTLFPEKFDKITKKVFLERDTNFIRAYGLISTILSVVFLFLALFIY